MTKLAHDYPELAAPQPPAHWLDNAWRYVPAASHADASDFRKRQQERLAEAQKHRTAA